MQIRTRLLIDYYVGGAAHVLLKPAVMLLGLLLKRNHALRPAGDVTIVKLLGGGSLVVAYPALLAIKSDPGVKRLRLLASPATRPFGELLDIFDEIMVIRDDQTIPLVHDSARAIRRLWRCDTLIDLEIHSRLTTIFCLLTCARNRVGFYTMESFWRKNISTHLLFCQLNEGIYHFYDQLAELLGASVLPFSQCRLQFRRGLGLPDSPDPSRSSLRTIAIAPCCSGFATERMLELDEWIQVLKKRFPVDNVPAELHLLGGPSDAAYLGQLKLRIEQNGLAVKVIDHAGHSTLRDSVLLLSRVDELLAIDSSMLHLARLLGTRTVSYWGPTDPATRLRPSDPGMDETHYAKLPCSPCVHLSSKLPCGGNNLCIRFAVDPDRKGNRNPPWLA